jgi:hypothetical protein
LQPDLIGNVGKNAHKLLAVNKDGDIGIFESKIFFLFVFEFLPGSHGHFESLVLDICVDFKTVVFVFFDFDISHKAVLVKD